MIRKASQFWIEDPLRKVSQPVLFITQADNEVDAAGKDGLGTTFVMNARLINSGNLPLFRHSVVNGDGVKFTYSRIFDKESVIINVPAAGGKEYIEEEVTTTEVIDIMPAFELSDNSGNLVGLAICTSGLWEESGWNIVTFDSSLVDPFEYGHWTIYYTIKPFIGDLEDKNISTSGGNVYEVAPSGYHNKVWELAFYGNIGGIGTDYYNAAIIGNFEDNPLGEPHYSEIGVSRSARQWSIIYHDYEFPDDYYSIGYGYIPGAVINIVTSVEQGYADHSIVDSIYIVDDVNITAIDAIGTAVRSSNEYAILCFTYNATVIGGSSTNSTPVVKMIIDGNVFQLSPYNGSIIYNWIPFEDPEFGTAYWYPFDAANSNIRYYKFEGKTYVLHAIPDYYQDPIGGYISNPKIRYLFICPEDSTFNFSVSFDQLRDDSNNPYHMIGDYYCFSKFRLVKSTRVVEKISERKIRRS